MPEPARRVVLVTGANRGIGREVCRQLGARGYAVVLAARDAGQGAAAAEGLAGDGLSVEACVLDVTDARSVAACAAWVHARHGRLDALVNNAGACYDTWERVLDADAERLFDTARAAFEINALGAWRTCQAFAPLLRQAGRGGRVVNVSSEAGSLAGMRGGGTPAYAVSKAALNAVTRLVAAELHPAGVLVNAVCPGWVATDMGGVGGRPVADGAASVVWGVALPDGGPSGGFFRDGRPLPW
jgi:NAD(P)-dependent dehydrogenase (short-subunit alcohol dehydrogenase family)